MKDKFYTFCLLIILFSNISAAQEDATNSLFIKNFEKTNNILECDGIRMTNYTGTINRSQVYYGEKIDFNYDNISGFKLTDSIAYPDVSVYALDVKGDTILSKKNLFKDIEEDYKINELNLYNSVTFANPFLTGNTYTIYVEIIDKKSDAFYNWKKEFTVIEHPRFHNEANGIDLKICYLYSANRDISIIDDSILPYEDVYLILEGMEGITTDSDGMASVECSMTLANSNNKILLSNLNMFPELIKAKDLETKLFSNITVNDKVINNPIHCSIEIKDRWSDKYFKSDFKLIVLIK